MTAPKPKPALRERAPPRRQPSAQATPVAGQRLEEVEPRDGRAPAEPPKPRRRTVRRCEVTQRSGGRAGDTVPGRVPEPEPHDGEGPWDEDPEQCERDEREEELHGPAQERQDAPAAPVVHRLES